MKPFGSMSFILKGILSLFWGLGWLGWGQTWHVSWSRSCACTRCTICSQLKESSGLCFLRITSCSTVSYTFYFKMKKRKLCIFYILYIHVDICLIWSPEGGNYNSSKVYILGYCVAGLPRNTWPWKPLWLSWVLLLPTVGSARLVELPLPGIDYLAKANYQLISAMGNGPFRLLKCLRYAHIPSPFSSSHSPTFEFRVPKAFKKRSSGRCEAGCETLGCIL